MEKKDVAKTFKSQFDRLLIIDSLLRNKEYPTTKKIAEKLELSERQVQRLIKMMQKEFAAPIIKDGRKNNGFCYGLEGFSITNIAYSENETFALQVCSNFARRTLRGSEIYKKLDKGLSTLQNFAESYDTDEGAKLANRVQFAIKTNPMGDNLKSNQDKFEDVLLDSIKDGQLIKISIRSWNDNSIHQEIVLPVLLSMYGDFSWILVYVKKEAFSEDFLSVNLTLENIGVVDVSTITAINLYKDSFATPVFVENEFSYIGESAVYAVENPKKDGIENNLGLCFTLSFPKLSNLNAFNIFAHYYFDYEKSEYQIDDSVEYQILDGVFVVGSEKYLKDMTKEKEIQIPSELQN